MFYDARIISLQYYIILVDSGLMYSWVIIKSILAPGTYSPEKVNLNRGPEYSLYGKGKEEKRNDSPGKFRI